MSIEFMGFDYSEPIKFVSLYSDSTPMVKTDQWENICNKADTLVLRADSLQEFMVGMFLVDVINDRSNKINTLVLPYLPGARQDRSNPTGDVLFTAKSIAKEINSREFDKVISVDPHSPTMPVLINNFVEYPLAKLYEKLWRGYGGVIAPDNGAGHRAAIAAGVISRDQFQEDSTGKGYLWATKTRDVSTGRITGFQVPELVPGTHYLVVDDICDGGGTFIGLGEKIKEQGAYADLFVTHGIFSKGTTALHKFYKNIYTTDTRGMSLNAYTDYLKFDIVKDMVNYNA